MEKIKLEKDWGDYKAGTVFHVLGSGVVLERSGDVRESATGRLLKGPGVDPDKVESLRAAGYLDKPAKKKRAARAGGK